MSSAALTSGQSSEARKSSGRVRVKFLVQGMTCAAYAAKVESRLNAVENVSATVNYATEKATVTKPASVPVQALIDEIEQAGYGAELASAADGGSAEASGAGRDAARVAYLRRRLVVALVFFVPLSDLSVLLSLLRAYRFVGWRWVLVGGTGAAEQVTSCPG